VNPSPDTALTAELLARLRDVPDFPKPGILFKDITPVLADPRLFGRVVNALGAPFRGQHVTKVVGIEARGFMFGAPVALALDAGFVPARKPGKLPWRTLQERYALEYGTDGLELHEDALRPGERVLVVDDLLATGGTAAAAGALVRRLGGELVGFAFVAELGFLPGRSRLDAANVHTLLTL
jgi:adenine phosphoribosyltransferase